MITKPLGKHGETVLNNELKTFYEGKKVLITGHTGFKGTWLCHILHHLGAKIYGYALDPPTNPNLYTSLNTDAYVTSTIGDISDYEKLYKCYESIKPDIVFHLAAQPIVRESYRDPRGTYITNVIGTVNILECIRKLGASSFLNVTTDKVYDNLETDYYYKENDRLDGFDPYSNSKSCSELITHSYTRSFDTMMCPTSTARAGNVIGGGDFAAERIVPDCVRAAINNEKIVLRNPNSIRPYQHVLEPLFAYIMIAYKQTTNSKYSGNYNIGPDPIDCISTKKIAELFCKHWGDGLEYVCQNDGGPHEANYLKLDNSLIKQTMGLSPLWHTEKAIEKVVEWSKIWAHNGNTIQIINKQISEYFTDRGYETKYTKSFIDV